MAAQFHLHASRKVSFRPPRARSGQTRPHICCRIDVRAGRTCCFAPIACSHRLPDFLCRSFPSLTRCTRFGALPPRSAANNLQTGSNHHPTNRNSRHRLACFSSTRSGVSLAGKLAAFAHSSCSEKWFLHPDPAFFRTMVGEPTVAGRRGIWKCFFRRSQAGARCIVCLTGGGKMGCAGRVTDCVTSSCMPALLSVLERRSPRRKIGEHLDSALG